jgi:hypothetical protein
LNANKQLKNIQEAIKAKEPKIQFNHLLAGFKIDYPEYNQIFINECYTLNQNKELDTLYLLSVEFKVGLDEKGRTKLNQKLSQRMKLELDQKAGVKQDSVRVIVLN